MKCTAVSSLYSGTLCSVSEQFVNDVSGQHFGPFFKRQDVQEI